VQERAESTFGTLDTGIKLHIMYFSMSEPGKLKIRTQAYRPDSTLEAVSMKTEPVKICAEIDITKNLLVMLNSRAFTYEIDQPNKCFMFTTFVPGPSSPMQTGPSFL
jgi:hypothetical protein